MAVQTPYVEYIKISRIDELGQDLTPTLEALTQIKLPFTNGVSRTYYPISRTRYNDYFLFSLSRNNNAGPLAADASTIDYAYTGSVTTTTVSHYFPSPFSLSSGVYDMIPIPQSPPTTDPLGFYNDVAQCYQFDTFPQKDVVFDFEASVTYPNTLIDPQVRIGAYLLDQSGTYSYDLTQGGPEVLFQNVYTAGSTININESITIAKEKIIPGYRIIFLFSQGIGYGGMINLTFSPTNSFRISSTPTSGPSLETIPEPFLPSQFYGTDCDVLLNNVEIYRKNPFLQDIDYSGNPNIPVNFNALLSGSAVLGTVPSSYYTTQYHAGPRYRGTKNQSIDINYYTPDSPRYDEDFRYVEKSNLSDITSGIQIFDLKNKVLGFFDIGTVPFNPTPLIPGFSSSVILPDDAPFLIPVTATAVTNTDHNSGNPVLVNKSFNGIYINPNSIKTLATSFSNFTINFKITGNIGLDGGVFPVYIGLSLFSYDGPPTSAIVNRSIDFSSADYSFQRLLQMPGGTSRSVNLTGTIPASEINRNVNLLAFAIEGTPFASVTEVSVSNLKIELWVAGTPENIGNYGQLPPVTQNDANIYEYEWGGGTTPEILDWGAVRMSKILQVSSKDLVKTINPSSDIEIKTLPQKSNEESNGSTTARSYRKVINAETGLASYPDNTPTGSIPTSSIYDPSFNPLGSSTDFQRSFWLGPKKVSEYSETMEVNNKMNAEISFFPYPNQANAGSNPTIPNTTKILTTEFGVPGISNYGLTSSYGNMNGAQSPSGSARYGFISQNSPYIRLYRDSKVSRLKRDSNGYYQAGAALKPNWSTLGNQINTDLNNGGRWFVTMYNELEWPNGTGDFNSALTTGSLTPYNIGYSTKDNRGNYPNPFQYKGVWEILGTNDTFGSSDSIFYILCDENFKVPTNSVGNNPPDLGGTMNIGGNVPGNSLGMLIWKARAAGKSDFIMVQDNVTGGVGAGGLVSKFAPDYIKEHFEEITKEYGANTPS